jgi:LPXTG-motif cell wall-anchored protein
VTTPSSYTVQLDAGENYLDADFGIVAVLPVTGLDTTNIAMIALALLLAGGVAVFITTRKRKDEDNIAA